MFTGSSSLFGALSLTVHLAIRMLFCSFSVNLCALDGNARRTEKRNP
jgi:hypothetical protein